MSASPCLLMVAPNGARRVYQDHPAIPLTPEELARDAQECLAAGASAMHVHVRETDGRHLLDAGAYQDAISAIQEAVGDQLLLQVTSEAGGRYSPSEQRRVIEALPLDSVSIAVREWFGDAYEVRASGELCRYLASRGTHIQYIVYSPEDLTYFNQLREQGDVPNGPAFLLFVLGRYADPPIADPSRLPSFLHALVAGDHWAVCAFGPTEGDCLALAAQQGGHARVGFENNLWRADGQLATNNAELVAATKARIEATGRRVMSASEARRFLALTTAANTGVTL
ncbi:3-keto-5-aminohexanoate cleavage protein [Vreelandella venusta]|uniref:3-keto-5-aminohexanoate cleavage protein n=1 Tax=Vreelandella venusta TaxID=44935 RepID=UPI00200BDBD4|nr:3-keto-5-aminohexanoate cleavage protein [Halomonas venusta]UQI40387.1 3-keto-5-aminohexanoate cleavage protein [Halomonas venusta]